MQLNGGNMMEELIIYVITHKEFNMDLPSNYKKLFVGSYNKKKIDGYLLDSTGNNISEKNKYYCELTGLYWIWKNVNIDYIGLSHYRRYFSNILGKPISTERLLNLLNYNDIILPSRRIMNDTVYDEYKKSHYIKDLENCQKVIQEIFPEYIEDYKYVMKKKSMFGCNMFVAKKKLMDQYCRWLFRILDEVEKMTDVSEYDEYQKRVYGFLSERLFNIWLHHNKLKIKEMNILITEEPRIKGIKRVVVGKVKKMRGMIKHEI